MLDHIFHRVTRWLAPLLCFTAEEAWTTRFGDGEGESVHLQRFADTPPDWRDPELAASMDRVRSVRRVVTGALEEARRGKRMGASLGAAPVVYVEDPVVAGDLVRIDFAELCIVSGVSVLDGNRSEGRVPARGCAGRVRQGGAGIGNTMRSLLAGSGGGRKRCLRAMRLGTLKPVGPCKCGAWRGIAVAASVVAVDRLSKAWALDLPLLADGREILPFLRIVRTWNPGINFRVFSDSQDLSLVLIALAVVIGVGLLAWTNGTSQLWHNVSCGLIAGGSFGNAVDRLIYGAVHDFLNVSCCGLRNPYAFNLADTAIFLGVILLVVRR